MNKAPFNFGYVSSSVVVYPGSYPIKERSRQYNEMTFNEVTLKNLELISGKETAEIISSGMPGGNYGVTIKPLFVFQSNYLYLLSPGAQVTNSGVYSINSLTSMCSWIKDSDKGATHWHNSFVGINSLFQDLSSNENDFIAAGNRVIKDGGGLGGTAEQSIINNFYESSNPRLGMAEETFVGSVKTENDRRINIDFIRNNNIYVGAQPNFINSIPLTIYNKYLYSEGEISGLDDGFQFPGGKKGETVAVHQWVTPGVHCGIEKLVPNFPGQDFTYTFKKLTSQHPIAHNDVSDLPEKKYHYFAYNNDYDCLEVFSQIGGKHLVLGSGTSSKIYSSYDLTLKFDEFKQSYNKSGYYLANQPYIVLELPFSSTRNVAEEETLFLIIPNNGKVILVNASKRARMIESKNSKNVLETFFVKPSFRMSKIIYDFKISGSSLLSKDMFSIKIQHLYGYLQISFDDNPSHVISEERFDQTVLDGVFGAELLSEGGFVTKIDLSESNYSNLAPVRDSIVVHGKPRIFWGNSHYAINSSAIEYETSAKIKLNYPLPIIGRFKSDQTEDIVAASGSASGSAGAQNSEKNTYILLRNKASNNEDGFIDGDLSLLPDMKFSIFKNQAGSFSEIIQGKNKETSADIMPKEFRNSIPGSFIKGNNPNAPTENSYGLFQYDFAADSINPSKIIISKTANAPRGINNQQGSDNYSFATNISIELTSGSITLLNPYKDTGGTTSIYSGNFCRPILFSYSLLIREDDGPAVDVSPVNISSLVRSFRETWTRADRHSIQHTGDLTLYIPKNIPNSVFSHNVVSSNLSGATQYGDSVSFGGNLQEFIMGLQDKQFFIRIYLGRFLNSESDNASQYDPLHPYFDGGVTNVATQEAENPFLSFTGLCNQVDYTIKDSYIEVTMRLQDYKKILDDTIFLNSAFYDAVRDYNAVYDVLSQCGLRSSGADAIEGDLPLDLLSIMLSKETNIESTDGVPFVWKGNTYYYFNYILPGAYDTLNSPKFKPALGSNVSSFVDNIAQISGKTFFFDRFGIAHFDIPPDEIEYLNSNSSRRHNSSSSVWNPKIKYKHASDDEIWDFYTSIDYKKFNSPKFKIWNVISANNFKFNKKVSDIFNEIRVISTSPDMKLMLMAHTNINSIYDPTSPGFLGYRKIFLQQNGVFGSKEALEKILNYYTMFFNPPLFCSFTVPGRVGVMPNQFFRLHHSSYSVEDKEGNPTKISAYIVGIITDVTNSIDKSNNTWTTDITGRYMYPGENISFTKTEVGIGV